MLFALHFDALCHALRRFPQKPLFKLHLKPHLKLHLKPYLTARLKALNED
jgi:hypothetical protein